MSNNHEAGFTLVESMVTLVISAIALMVGAMAISATQTKTLQIVSAAQELYDASSCVIEQRAKYRNGGLNSVHNGDVQTRCGRSAGSTTATFYTVRFDNAGANDTSTMKLVRSTDASKVEEALRLMVVKNSSTELIYVLGQE